MGVYIYEKTAPNSCTECFYAVRCDKCIFKGDLINKDTMYYYNYKPKDCPMVEIDDNKVKQLLK